MGRTPKPDLNTKVGKYYLARKKGLNKTQARELAGYSGIQDIEERKNYQEIARYFKDELLDQMKLQEIATELIKNIKQDTDKGAKNTAIKIAIDKIEPEAHAEDDDKQVFVVLKQIKPIEAEVEEVIDATTEEIEEDTPEVA